MTGKKGVMEKLPWTLTLIPYKRSKLQTSNSGSLNLPQFYLLTISQALLISALGLKTKQKSKKQKPQQGSLPKNAMYAVTDSILGY